MVPQTAFRQRLDGSFTGVLRWPQLDSLWAAITAQSTPWYLYQVGSPVPDQPLYGESFTESIKRLDQLLRQEHDYDYCGIVYADDLDKPSLIKIYDPNNLGSSCGCSGNRIPPRWIISQDRPTPIEDQAPTPNNRRRWWEKLLHLH